MKFTPVVLAFLAGASVTSVAETISSQTISVDPAPTTELPMLILGGTLSTLTPTSVPGRGLSMSYHPASATTTSASILRLHDPNGHFEWQLSTSASDERLAMALDNDHVLSLFKADSSTPPIIIDPGSATVAPSIKVGGVPVALESFSPSRWAGGLSSTASGTSSFAFGEGLTAAASNQTVVGRWNSISSSNDPSQGVLFTVGNGTSTTARANALTVKGSGKVSLARSLEVGNEVRTDGVGSIVVGWNSYAFSDYASAFGSSNYSTGFCSSTIGGWNMSSSFASIAMGSGSGAYMSAAFAVGQSCTAENQYSVSMGNRSRSTGFAAVAAGCGAFSLADCSTALGLGTEARSFGQTVVGRFNATQQGRTAINDPRNDSDLLFIVGNGNQKYNTDGSAKFLDAPNNTVADAWRSNAFTINNKGDTWVAGNFKVEGDSSVTGVLRVKPAGDLTMGPFTAGPQP